MKSCPKLDYVRGYFGEHVALYFAWLGLYTRFLAYPMFLGVLTMTGYDIWGDDNNRFALPYSCFLSLWSTVFLESWTRTENDLVRAAPPPSPPLSVHHNRLDLLPTLSLPEIPLGE
jgi:hypothetical protein